MKQSLELLAAAAAGYVMAHVQVEVLQLVVAHGVETAQGTVGALGGEQPVVLGARQAPAEGEGDAVVIAVATLVQHQPAQVPGLVRFVLDPVVVKAAAGIENDLAETVVEIVPAGTRQVMFDEYRLGIRFEDDQVARLGQQWGIAAAVEPEKLDGRFQFHAGGNVQEQAVVDQCRVEGGEQVLAGIGHAAEAVLHPFVSAGDGLGQTAGGHFVGQQGHVREGGHEPAVHEDQPVGGDGLGQRTIIATGTVHHRLEGLAQDGFHVGVAPGLLLAIHRGQLVDEAAGAVAQLLQPGCGCSPAAGEQRPGPAFLQLGGDHAAASSSRIQP